MAPATNRPGLLKCPFGRTGADAYVPGCEASSDRRSLLRLSFVFCDPESLQLAWRTDERDFRVYQNAAVDAQASPARVGRGVLGRGHAGAASEIAASLQGNAQRNAKTDGSAARFHSGNADSAAWVQKYFPAQY